MPIARVQMSDGRIARVEVPEGTTTEQVMQFLGGVNDTTGPSGPAGNPWEKAAQSLDQMAPKPQAPATDFGPLEKPYSGSILPFTRDERGNISFDPQAGILGPFTRPVKMTQDVAEGKIDPMSPEAIPGELEAALVMSPVSAATRAGERMVPGMATSHRKVAPNAPTVEQLKYAADAGYKNVRGMGAEYTGEAVKRFADDAVNALNAESRIAELNPQTFALLNKLQNPPAGSTANIGALDAFRRRLNDIAGSPDRGVASTAEMVIRRLDDWLAKPDPSDIRTAAAQAGGASNLPRIGGAAEIAPEQIQSMAAQALKEARGNAAAGFRSDRLTGVADAAELRAAAANSGQNLGNSLRGRLASLLLSAKQSRGFSPEELKAIEQVVDGTATTNTLRRVGNMLGAGGGLGQTLMTIVGGAAGGAAGGGAGAAVGAAAPVVVGTAARQAGNKLTQRQLANVDKMVRMRSPLYEKLLADAPYEANPRMLESEFIRALLAGQMAPTP